MAEQKCTPGNEPQSDALVALLNKALAYPSPGVQVGAGKHVVMPATWNGTGKTPLGWTKTAAPVWVKDSGTAWVPIPDTLAATLQGAPAQARLTPGEQGTLMGAIAARVAIDPEAQGASPKASAAVQAAQRT